MASPLKKQRDAILLRVKRNSSTVATDAASQVLAASEDSLHLKLVEFEQDKLALKDLVSIKDKIEHKKSVLVPKWKPTVESYLEAGEAYQNPIFSDLIVWLFDAEDLDTAIDWCVKAIEKGLPTPENLKCDWPTFATRSVLAWAQSQYEKGLSFEPFYGQVDSKLSDKTWTAPDKLYAEWLKFAAYALLTNEDGEVKPSHVGNKETLEQSLSLMEKANDLHGKIGVGSKIKEVKARLRALEKGTNL